jgi:hypothetical protein
VDWFLDQLLLPPGHFEPTGMGEDPWRDLDVVSQFTRSEVSDPANDGEHFAGDCKNGWRDLGQLPGTHLRSGQVGKVHDELRTAEQQTIASLDRRSLTFSIRDRSFTWKTSPARSSSPGIAELAARYRRDYLGHFSSAKVGLYRRLELLYIGYGKIGSGRPRELVDETGIPFCTPAGRITASGPALVSRSPISGGSGF